jgi:PII-like signaling protein
MSRLDGEQTLMRIFLCEADRWEKKSLYEALLDLFLERGIAGATVLKGAAGYGGKSILHTDKLLRFSAALPVVVEVVDSQEKIEALLPELDTMIDSGMITLEKARVIRYFA